MTPTGLKRFKNDVITEVINLKKEITNNEKQRLLNFLKTKKIEPAHMVRCIYGVLTKDCYSERAFYLINKCAIAFSDRLINYIRFTKNNSLTITESRDFTALEVYICLYKKDITKITDYLTDKTDTLIL